MSEPILKVEHLKKYFPTPKGMLQAVDDVSFTVDRGQTLGIVGESGCGKSTTGRAILRLIEPTAGKVIFDGQDVTALSSRQMRSMRKQMQIIFQDPFSSIDPRKSVSQTIMEPLLEQKIYSSRVEAQKRVQELMEMVELEQRLTNSYPHELDGGRRQRVGIARALALSPKMIICDEPVSALDVSIQAQVINLLSDLQENLSLTYLFITHDLSVVKHLSDHIVVMYLGKVVEKAPAEELFRNPLHPYTQALLSAIPMPTLHNRKKRIVLKSEVTSPINMGDECRFRSRCMYACDKCRQKNPELVEVSPDHFVACSCLNEF